MDLWISIGALVIFLPTAFLKGITGLGFATICLPVLTLFIDPRISIPLVIVPSLSSNLLVMAQAGNFRRALIRFWPLLLATVPGLLLGVHLLISVDIAWSRRVLGSILIIYSVWAFSGREADLTRGGERLWRVPAGLLTGLVYGLTGSQVMPVLPYMLSLKMDRDLFLQSINLFFTFSSLLLLLLLGRQGLLNGPMMAVALAGVVPVAIGIHLGGRIRERLSEAAYRRAVLIFLALIGLSLVVRA